MKFARNYIGHKKILQNTNLEKNKLINLRFQQGHGLFSSGKVDINYFTKGIIKILYI